MLFAKLLGRVMAQLDHEHIHSME